MARAARSTGAPEPVVAAATETSTARHFFETCVSLGVTEPLTVLCRQARQACEAHAGGEVSVDVRMVDFEGRDVVAAAS